MRATAAVVAATILTAAAVCQACGPRRGAEQHTGRVIALTDSLINAAGAEVVVADTIHLGRMRSGEIAQIQLWLQNNSSRPVAITAYERSCGCTTFEYSAEPVAVGSGRQITLTYDSRGEWGWQMRIVDITLAGAPKPLRIFVEAQVE